MLMNLWLIATALIAALWSLAQMNQFPRIGRWLSKTTTLMVFSASMIALCEIRSFPLLLLALIFHMLALLIEHIYRRLVLAS